MSEQHQEQRLENPEHRFGLLEDLVEADMRTMEAKNENQKVQQFCIDRLNKIRNEEVWHPMSEGPYCVLHWMPTLSTRQQFIDIDSIGRDYEDFIVFRVGVDVNPPQKNSDGFLIDTNFGEDAGEWSERPDGWCFRLRGFQRTQIFHSGALEAVYAPPFEKRKGKETKYLSLYAFEFFRRQIQNCMKKASDLGFSGAGAIGVSILGVKGYSIYTPVISARYLVQLPQKIPDDADEVLNEAEGDIGLSMKIPNITDINNKILQPIFDRSWRGFGFLECDRNFQDGSWNLQR